MSSCFRSIQLETGVGGMIGDFISEAIEISKKVGLPCSFKFNGKVIKVDSNSDISKVIEGYMNSSY